jgi:hypothetical protein
MRILLSGLAAASTLALAANAQTPATNPAPDLDQSVHCAALFALVAADQKAGKAAALRHPPLGERGKAFFVETSLRLRDERAVPLESVAELYRNEVAKIAGAATDVGARNHRIATEMPGCLALLDRSVPLAPSP